MHAMTGQAGTAGRGQRSALIAPARVAIRRPGHGWVAGLLGAGMKAVAMLVAVTVVLAMLAGVTVALWWVGQARIPVLVLVYGSVAVAGCGFALGRSGRLLTLARWPRLPEGPNQVTWPPGVGRVETGLIWEQDDPAIIAPAAPGDEENTQ